MIISGKKKFVFIHNPKVAGSSVRKALEQYRDDPREFWHQGWFPRENRLIDLAHMTVDQWYPIVNPQFTSFGFVRNPYERFVSGLREVMRRHAKDLDVIMAKPELMRLALTPANLRWDWRFIHLCPQHYFFYEGNKRRVDHIGKIENLEVEWAAVTSLLGIHETLPELRVADGNDEFTELLGKDWVIELVNDLYLRDFQLFGYELQRDVVPALSHSERVAAIHDPARIAFFTPTDLENINFSAGEQAALSNRDKK